MNKSDSNTSAEAVKQYSEKESPPFALDDHFSSLKDQHDKKIREAFDEISLLKLSQQPAEIGSRCDQFTSTTCNKDSTPPDLAESATTDETSCCSVFSTPKSEDTKSTDQTTKASSSPSPSLSHPISFQSSIISTSSLTSVLLEPRLPSGDFFPVDNESFKTATASSHDPHIIIRQSDRNSSSIGFSELMEAADDSNIDFEQYHPTTRLSDHRSSEKLPPLPENQEIESCILISAENQEVESDALISALTAIDSVSVTQTSNRKGKVGKWWRDMSLFESGSHGANFELKRPLSNTFSGTNANNDGSRIPHITRLLSTDTIQNQYINLALKQASASVQTQIESEDSFEVSMLLQENAQCKVEDVIEVIGNTDLLNLWCSPIESVIVTTSSNEGASSTNLDEEKINIECDFNGSCRLHDDVNEIRDYEAEWIEATTSSLESPYSSLGFFLKAGQSALQSLGCASYGRITMFIERRQGLIGLTIGPFHGGIHAFHSISVSQEYPNSNSRRIRIVDRVRLTRDNQEESYFSGGILGCAMGSYLSHFFFPSITGYVDQVTLSMARLRILLENDGSDRYGSHPCF